MKHYFRTVSTLLSLLLSPYLLAQHKPLGGFAYGTKVINKKVMTIKEYMKKAHIGSDRTVWRYE